MSLSHRSRAFRLPALAALTAGGVALALAVTADPAGANSSFRGSDDHHGEQFTQTNLVADTAAFGAQLVDPNLRNACGMSLSATSPIWVSDNAAGVSTLYSVAAGGTGVTKVGLTVAVPGGRASTGDGPSPTGQVFNPTTGFVVSSAAGSGPAKFIFDSESGQITAWNPAAAPTDAIVEYSSPTAVYKGLTIATGDAGTFLYASNFHDGTVDVFDSAFHPVTMPGGFKDRTLPAGYAPFGIQNLNGLIYVSYARQNAAKHDDVAGQGRGFVDVFTANGFLVERLASHGALNSPWGLAFAPAGFGRFGGALLVGNFGDGHINAYDPFSGRFLGQLRDGHDRPVVIDGLWGLTFGTASTGGTGTLLFSAGPNGEQDGLFGALNPAK
ncbi:MAG: TIGR03118 family protein [Actinocrinis sp.]